MPDTALSTRLKPSMVLRISSVIAADSLAVNRGFGLSADESVGTDEAVEWVSL
jgi:hypothetical protein